MVKVAIPKNEYEQLKRQAEAYRIFAERFFEAAIKTPVEQVVEDFQKTGLYTEAFLRDLKSGLSRSSYGKKYGNKAVKRRS